MRDPKRLLWLDCSGGLMVGVLVLSASGWLAELYALPRAVVVSAGIANLAYGTYSLSLALRASRPRSLLLVLIAANALWSLLCVATAVVFVGRASAFGLAAIVAEAVVVGGLAALEWRYRAQLL
jgi:hypothetical protein